MFLFPITNKQTKTDIFEGFRVWYKQKEYKENRDTDHGTVYFPWDIYKQPTH